MRAVKIFQWDAAHKLCLPYESKCNSIHGHTYKVEIEMEGKLNAQGMVMDFKDLKKWVESVSFDHSFLNDIPDFKELNPTAELLVKYLHKELTLKMEGKGPTISRIRVWETPNSYAEESWDATQIEVYNAINRHITEDNEKLKQMHDSLKESVVVLNKIKPLIDANQAALKRQVKEKVARKTKGK